jgi:hypothetical protein
MRKKSSHFLFSFYSHFNFFNFNLHKSFGWNWKRGIAFSSNELSPIEVLLCFFGEKKFQFDFKIFFRQTNSIIFLELDIIF